MYSIIYLYQTLTGHRDQSDRSKESTSRSLRLSDMFLKLIPLFCSVISLSHWPPLAFIDLLDDNPCSRDRHSEDKAEIVTRSGHPSQSHLRSHSHSQPEAPTLNVSLLLVCLRFVGSSVRRRPTSSSRCPAPIAQV